jgi:hypothetical protein
LVEFGWLKIKIYKRLKQQKMKNLLLITFLSVSSTMLAQPDLDWSFSFGQPSGVETPIGGSVTDANGNILITGFIYTGSPVDMEPGAGITNMTSSNTGDVYVAKYSKAGALLWVKTLPGTDFQTGQHIEIDNNGNIVITGILRGSVDMDPGLAIATLTATTTSGSGFIAKYDSLMNYLWSFEIPTGNTTNYVVNDIAIDTNNNILITGGFGNSISLDPLSSAGNYTASSSGGFVAKYTPNGIHTFSFPLIDSQTITDGRSVGIDVDSDNNLYVLGRFRSSINCDPNGSLIVTNNTSLAGYLAKYSPTGNAIWAIPVGTSVSGYSLMTRIEIDNSDNLVINGSIQPGTYDFDGSAMTANLTQNDSYDAFLAKYDSTGNYLWAFNLGGSDVVFAEDIAINAQDDIFLTGNTRNDSLDFDPTGNDAFSSVVQPGAFSSHFIAKYSNSGVYNWAYTPVDDDNEYSPQVAVYDTLVYMTGSGFVLDMDWNSLTPPQQYTIDQAYIFKIGDEQQCIPTAPIFDLSNLPTIIGECSVNAPTPPTASNCLGTFNGIPNVTFPITTQGTTTITWTYNDGNGNTSTQTQNVIIDDVTAPVANQGSLAAIITNCGQSVTSLTAPTATDNCTGTITGTHNASFPITSSTTINWTYNDGNGNTSTQNQTVTINADNVAPVANIATLSDVTSQCSVTTLIAPTATDNCAGVITATHNAALPITTQGTTTVTWTYDDGNGNTSTQTQNVFIDDVTAPVANQGSLAAIITNCGQSVTSLTAPTATDNCTGTITGTHNASFPITSSTTINWTYNDGNGNTSTQNQTVTINADNVAPVANIATLSDVTSQCSVTTLIAPTATDNCAGVITATHNAALPITTQGTTTVTWTYDDGNGNTSTQTQNVFIDDVTAPVANQGSLAAIITNCGQSVTSLTAPTATDNCTGTITGTHNASFPITSSTTINWTYNDGNGNTSTQNQTVTINADNVAPVANIATLSDVTSQCSVTTLIAPTATDNCAGVITATHNAALPITTQGTTTVTWTYDDGNGNTSTQTQSIVIDDVTDPVATLANLATITSECEVTPIAPTATDNCVGTITGTPDVTFPITASGTTLVTWTYNDGNGNTSIQTQNVVITPIDNGIIQVDAITLSASASGASYQWINCNNGNTIIPGATAQAFTPTANGNYAVIVTTTNCTDTSACQAITTIGIDELGASNIEVYPNPTNSSITIYSFTSFNRIEVLNALGQKVSEHNFNGTSNYELTLPEEVGVYLIKVVSNEITIVKRIVKN